MTEDGGIVCQSVSVKDGRREGGEMSEHEEPVETTVNVLLQEPEIVAWLRADETNDEDDDTPRAA
jgi:hypothetical protein